MASDFASDTVVSEVDDNPLDGIETRNGRCCAMPSPAALSSFATTLQSVFARSASKGAYEARLRGLSVCRMLSVFLPRASWQTCLPRATTWGPS